jgi:hypothetical protein
MFDFRAQINPDTNSQLQIKKSLLKFGYSLIIVPRSHFPLIQIHFLMGQSRKFSFLLKNKFSTRTSALKFPRSFEPTETHSSLKSPPSNPTLSLDFLELSSNFPVKTSFPLKSTYLHEKSESANYFYRTLL